MAVEGAERIKRVPKSITRKLHCQRDQAAPIAMTEGGDCYAALRAGNNAVLDHPISWLSTWWLSASIMAMPKNWYKMARMEFG